MGGCAGKEKPAFVAPPPAEPVTKILIIGAANAGKTSILSRYANDEFPVPDGAVLTDVPTIKMAQLSDGSPTKLQIIDTAGQEKFRTITSSYYRGAHGVIVVFDLNDMSSFQSLENWFSEIQRYADCPSILVGNKKDLDEAGRVAKPEDIKKWGQPYLECSALTGEGINEVFQAMIKETEERME